ncbi:MAG: SDR family oxidoreductase [Gemmatimonadales bacterium]
MNADSSERPRPFELQGKVGVITGASSGIGRALARVLAREGMKLGLLARGRDGLEAAATEVTDASGEALVLAADVADAEAVQHAADTVVAHWGRLDLWINNAMVSVFAPVEQVTPAEFRRVTEVNYLGYVHGTLAALRHMRMQDAGLIVQIGSALAYRSIPLQSAYCASKAAIRGFTDSVRSELAHNHSGVRITTIHLPAVNTPQFDVVRNKLAGHPSPVPPIYQPELIAEAILHAIRHPRRERWIGWSTVRAILAQRVMPGALDRYLAAAGWSSQQTASVPPNRRDNLDAPLPGDRGAHGVFDQEARARSLAIWAAMHRGWLAAGAALALAGLAAAGYRARIGRR